MRFGIIHSVADSRVSLFHYLPLVLTRDAEHPARWGRSKIVSIKDAGIQRGEGVALVYGPTADAVLDYITPMRLPDPQVVVVLAQPHDPAHPVVAKIRELSQRGQQVSVCCVVDGSAWLADRSTGGFSVKDKSHAPKDPSFIAPVVKPMAAPAAVAAPPAPSKKKTAAAPVEPVPAPSEETPPSAQ
jgi:hypothetical protein